MKRRAMAKEPSEIKIIASDYEMTLASPAIIEEVMQEWGRENPGRNAEDMTGEEFADRMMKKMYASAVKLPTGHA